MTPPPRPLILEKGRFRLLFNEPREQGCISIEIDGSGLAFPLNDTELMDLAGALISASRRIRSNRKAKP